MILTKAFFQSSTMFHAARALLLLSTVLISTGAANESPVVRTTKGDLSGRTIERLGQTIYAFEGIPYALPPVNKRRFQDSIEAEAWDGIKQTITHGPICMQIEDEEVVGEEDCLFLNVYTVASPDSWEDTKLPVVVWIHGGAYQGGSGNMDLQMPDLLLKKELLFVSINYRLNVLGFLNSEDGAAPGNAGLKDAVLALKWVKENIAAFGGDPGKVTIFGESAGSSAVHYLTISPMAEGLFRGAIALSGTAITSNMIMEEPLVTAKRLREKVECEENMDLVPCLQSVDANILVSHSMGSLDPNKVILEFCRDSFLPSIETKNSSDQPFLTEAPQDLMTKGPVIPVPLLIGTTDQESIVFLKMGGAFLEDPSRWQKLDSEENFEEAFLQDLPYGLRTEENVLLMRKNYLGNHSLEEAEANNDTFYGFLRMATDVYFGVGAVRAAEAAARRGASVYLYEFSYDSLPMAFAKRSFYNASHVAGVAHADDLPFVFYGGFQPAEKDAAVQETLVSMFANFIKTGDPTPGESSLTKWPKYHPDKEAYAEIDEEVTIKDIPLRGRMEFWRGLE